MEEVARQLQPTHTLLEKLDRWRNSLWSNGSGGPPGYLEVARAEDKTRFADLARRMGEIEDHKDVVNEFMTEIRTVRAERQKQEIAAKAAEEKRDLDRKALREKLLKIGWKVAVVALGLLGSLATWAYREAAPVVRVLWEEYLRAHPAVVHRMQNISENPTPVVASEAKIPPLQ